MKTALAGVWTPWAKVFCYECHGNKFPDTKQLHNGNIDFGTRSYGNDTWNELTQPYAIEEGYGVTHCDRCKREIQLDDNIAAEHNLVLKLRSLGFAAHMAQTGGMNSACEIDRKFERDLISDEEAPYYMVTYNFDGDKKYWFCAYDAEGEYNDEATISVDYENEIIEHIQKLYDVAKLRTFKYTDSLGGETSIIDEDKLRELAEYYRKNSDAEEDHELDLRPVDNALEFVRRVDIVEEVK